MIHNENLPICEHYCQRPSMTYGPRIYYMYFSGSTLIWYQIDTGDSHMYSRKLLLIVHREYFIHRNTIKPVILVLSKVNPQLPKTCVLSYWEDLMTKTCWSALQMTSVACLMEVIQKVCSANTLAFLLPLMLGISLSALWIRSHDQRWLQVVMLCVLIGVVY